MTAIITIASLLGLVGINSFRFFIPTFIFALILKLHDSRELFQTSSIDAMAAAAPGWFTQTPTLCILGILAVLELIAQREPAIKELITEDLDRYYKPVLNAALAFGFISPHDTQYLPSTDTVQQAGFGGYLLSTGGSIAVGVGTFFVVRIRARIREILNRFDEDNSFYLQSLANLIEESWVVFAVFIFIFVPGVLLIFICGVLMALWIVRLIFEKIEENQKHDCVECGRKGIVTRVYDTACMCRVCRSQQASICGVGAFGQALNVCIPPNGLEEHKFNLLTARRCPVCATGIKRGMPSACESCVEPIWTDSLSPEQYARRLDRKAMFVLSVVALLCVVPVVGLIIGVAWTQISLIRPFRVHLGAGSTRMLRILFFPVKLFIALAAIGFSLIPLLGIVPVIANYFLSRNSFLKQARKYSAP